MKRALVLSGGGLFGAWQVGAWSVLREVFQPDVVIGASVGALNGWAIAGGASTAELEQRWLKAAAEGGLQFRIPRRLWEGVADFSRIEGWIRELHASYRPKIEYYAVVTRLRDLRPQLVEGSRIEWRHLAASCALLGVLPQQRLDGVLYSDGGLLGALPLWAAHAIGARCAVGLQVMPRMPWPVRALLKPVRIWRRMPKPPPEGTLILSPIEPLGSWRQALLWENVRIREWIEQGRRDAERLLADKNISMAVCFSP